MEVIILIILAVIAIVIVLAYLIVKVWNKNNGPETTKLQTKKVIEDYDKFPVWGMERYNQLNGGATLYNGPMPGKASIGTPKVLSGFPLAPATSTEVIIFNPVIDTNSNLYFATYDSTNNISRIYGYDVTGNFELNGFPIVRNGIEITNPLLISSDDNLFYVGDFNTINIVNLSDIAGSTGYTNFPATMPVRIDKLMVSSSGRITFIDKDIIAAFFKVDKNAVPSFTPLGLGVLDYAVDENDDIYIASEASVAWWSTNNDFKTISYPMGTTSVASIAIGNDGNIYYAYGTPFLYGVTKQLNGLVKKFPFMALDPIVKVNTGGDGKIYATDDANRIYAVNSDGSFSWAETMNNLNNIYPTGNGNLFYITEDSTNVLVTGYDGTGQFLNRYPLTLTNKEKLAGTTLNSDYMAIGKNSTIYFPLLDKDDNKTKMYAIY